jgi:hypothetical protein
MRRISRIIAVSLVWLSAPGCQSAPEETRPESAEAPRGPRRRDAGEPALPSARGLCAKDELLLGDPRRASPRRRSSAARRSAAATPTRPTPRSRRSPATASKVSAPSSRRRDLLVGMRYFSGMPSSPDLCAPLTLTALLAGTTLISCQPRAGHAAAPTVAAAAAPAAPGRGAARDAGARGRGAVRWHAGGEQRDHRCGGARGRSRDDRRGRAGDHAARTGVTAVFPRGKRSLVPVFAGWSTLNGNGEMTGTTWVEEGRAARGAGDADQHEQRRRGPRRGDRVGDPAVPRDRRGVGGRAAGRGRDVRRVPERRRRVPRDARARVRGDGRGRGRAGRRGQRRRRDRDDGVPVQGGHRDGVAEDRGGRVHGRRAGPGELREARGAGDRGGRRSGGRSAT